MKTTPARQAIERAYLASLPKNAGDIEDANSIAAAFWQDADGGQRPLQDAEVERTAIRARP